MFGLSDQEFAAFLGLLVIFGIITLWVLIRVGFGELSHKVDLLLERTHQLDHHIRYPHLPPPDTDVE